MKIALIGCNQAVKLKTHAVLAMVSQQGSSQHSTISITAPGPSVGIVLVDHAKVGTKACSATYQDQGVKGLIEASLLH